MNKNVRILVLVTFLSMVAINALANIVPFNNMTTGEISDAYPNLFAPAPITFSIWSIIYLTLLMYALAQLTGKTGAFGPYQEKVAYFFIVSNIINSIWIVLWHYELMLGTLVLMIGLLVTLLLIRKLLYKAEIKGMAAWLVKTPFSIYLGWIIVATIANVTTFLVSVDWDGFGISESVWTGLIIIIGMAIVIATMLRFKDLWIGGVALWAYAGIMIKHVTTFDSDYPLVIIAASVASTLIVIVMVRMIFKKKTVID